MKIVRTAPYVKAIGKLKIKREEMEAFEDAIAMNPFVGVLIPGLGGMRKLRFAFSG